MHDGFRFLRCFSLQTKFFKPFHRLPLNLGSNFVVWLPFCEITHRSDQCHYPGLAQGFAGLKTVQPVEKNEPPIFIAADQDWSLLTHLKDALSDAFHHYGINAPSPFNRNVNLVDWDVFWLAHDCRIKAGNFDERNSLACQGQGLDRTSLRLRTYSMTSSAMSNISRLTVRPNSLAVLTLMTSSNLVGCSTGSSEGFAPFRILSTYGAVCRAS